MILAARDAGAGLLAKFQLYDAEDDKGKPHYAIAKACELSFRDAKDLFRFGADNGIEVFFSVFHPRYVEWCEQIGVKRYKIASTWHRQPVELDAVIATGKPIIISLPSENAPNVSNKQLEAMAGHSEWLYCPSGYPQRDITLPFFRDRESPFDGFSDHTIGLDFAKIALARGARIIEKHFCLQREGNLAPDIPWSMEPAELSELVRWQTVCGGIIE